MEKELNNKEVCELEIYKEDFNSYGLIYLVGGYNWKEKSPSVKIGMTEKDTLVTYTGDRGRSYISCQDTPTFLFVKRTPYVFPNKIEHDLRYAPKLKSFRRKNCLDRPEWFSNSEFVIDFLKSNIHSAELHCLIKDFFKERLTPLEDLLEKTPEILSELKTENYSIDEIKKILGEEYNSHYFCRNLFYGYANFPSDYFGKRLDENYESEWGEKLLIDTKEIRYFSLNFPKYFPNVIFRIDLYKLILKLMYDDPHETYYSPYNRYCIENIPLSEDLVSKKEKIFTHDIIVNTDISYYGNQDFNKIISAGRRLLEQEIIRILTSIKENNGKRN